MLCSDDKDYCQGLEQIDEETSVGEAVYLCV